MVDSIVHRRCSDFRRVRRRTTNTQRVLPSLTAAHPCPTATVPRYRCHLPHNTHLGPTSGAANVLDIGRGAHKREFSRSLWHRFAARAAFIPDERSETISEFPAALTAEYIADIALISAQVTAMSITTVEQSADPSALPEAQPGKLAGLGSCPTQHGLM